MNERIKELLTEAGFCFWQDEEWGPGAGNIDWSADYTKEFGEFVNLLIRDCAGMLEEYGMVEVAMEVKDRYGVK